MNTDRALCGLPLKGGRAQIFLILLVNLTSYPQKQVIFVIAREIFHILA